MQRYHSQKSERIRIKRKKIALKYGLRTQNFDNRHPLDCGNTKCKICHWDKFMGRRGRRLFDENYTQD